jgi:ubiquinol-cytochrome c reductase cytochrome b subunit
VTRLSRTSLNQLIRYAFFIFVPYFKASSVFGLSLLLNMVTQFLSGFLLSLFYVPDPSFVITFREEYMHEVWWYFAVYKLHVVGVDTIFVLSYMHILKKIFIKNFIETDLDGWFTGAYAFLIFHAVVFLGITLSTNHLGEVTITIASNIYWSLLLR